MIANLMALSVRARWAILFLFLAVGGLGIWQLTRLPIDAVPDITNKQVQINTIDKGNGSPLDWAVCWSSRKFCKWLESVGGKRYDV